MRLIDADEYKKLLIFLKQDCERYGQIDCAEEIRLVIEQLDNMPTINAEPVVYGHWDIVDNRRSYKILQCSKRLHARCLDKDEKNPDCEICGAKMDEEVEQE